MFKQSVLTLAAALACPYFSDRSNRKQFELAHSINRNSVPLTNKSPAPIVTSTIRFFKVISEETYRRLSRTEQEGNNIPCPHNHKYLWNYECNPTKHRNSTPLLLPILIGYC